MKKWHTTRESNPLSRSFGGFPTYPQSDDALKLVDTTRIELATPTLQVSVAPKEHVRPLKFIEARNYEKTYFVRLA